MSEPGPAGSTTAQTAQTAQTARTAQRAQTAQTAQRALLNLKNFLIENRTTLYAANPRGLDEIERGFMRLMRATLGPRVRLIGVPAGIRDWQTYVRLYCAYLVATGSISPPCTIFVSLPEGPGAHSASRSADTGPLRVCLLRADAIGRVRVLC